MSEFTAAVAGMVVGFVLCAIGGAIHGGLTRRSSMRKLLRRHFHRVDESKIKVHSKVYPYRVSLDVYRTMMQWIESNCEIDSQVGFANSDRFMSSVGIAAFLSTDEYYPAALEYTSFDIGEEQAVQCVRDAVWFGKCDQAKFALLWTSYTIDAVVVLRLCFD